MRRRFSDPIITRSIADEALYRGIQNGGGGGGEGLTQPAWFVDPANASGLASDNNTGLTAAKPLLTFKEIVRRWGSSSPALAQDTTITFLSSQPDLGVNDPINITPQLTGAGASLFFVGGLTQVATDHITTYTARNRATGTLGTITGTTITDFTAYDNLLVNAETVGSTAPSISAAFAAPIFLAGPAVTLSGTPAEAMNPLEIDITSGTTFSWSINGVVQATGVAIASTVVLGATGITANFPMSSDYAAGQFYQAFTSAWFWIDSTATATATISAPMVEALGINWPPPFATPPWVTIANGAKINIYSPIQINVQACALQNAGFVENNNDVNEIYFENLWLTSPPDSNFVPNYCVAEGCYFQLCRLDSTQLTQGQVFGGSVNCLSNGGFFGAVAFFEGGSVGATGTINIGTIPGSRGVTFDGDVIVHTNTPLKVGLGEVVFGFAYLQGSLLLEGKGDAWLTSTDENRVSYASGSAPFAALWGPGAIKISNGNAFRVVNAGGVTATNSILLTSENPITIDDLTTASFSSYAAGTWTSGIAPTPAATDAHVAVINPITDSRICLNGPNNLLPL